MKTVAVGDQRNLRFIWGEMRFFIGCLHLDAICWLYCGRRGGGGVLAPFYSKFVTEQKVNMLFIYMHANGRLRWGRQGGLRSRIDVTVSRCRNF